jgi:hypothetical protein
MPRIIRLRFHVENVPEGTLSARAWLQILNRPELIGIHEWCEPWPLLWTLSDRAAVAYCRRYHPEGPAAFLIGREIMIEGIEERPGGRLSDPYLKK